MISPYVRPFPQMLIDDWNRQHEGGQDCSEVSHGGRGLAGFTGVLRGSRRNEYFQFVSNLQLRSRVEAELAIFHLEALFALKGGALERF
jgi:hypothetical protein